MKITPALLKSIKPSSNGTSDKYSWNIYRYLKAHQNSRLAICWYEKDGKFDKEKSLASIKTFILLNGIDNNLCGARIYDLQHKGNHAELTTFSFLMWDPKQFIDITDWFFTSYQRKGRCLFDLNHSTWWADSDNRFTQINKNSRRCNWCGNHQRKVVNKEVSIKRNICWR